MLLWKIMLYREPIYGAFMPARAVQDANSITSFGSVLKSMKLQQQTQMTSRLRQRCTRESWQQGQKMSESGTHNENKRDWRWRKHREAASAAVMVQITASRADELQECAESAAKLVRDGRTLANANASRQPARLPQSPLPYPVYLSRWIWIGMACVKCDCH
jgi:hypothetical protein